MNDGRDDAFNECILCETAMSKEPIFTLREILIWSVILGSVVGYQLWRHADLPPLTIDLATIERHA